MIPETVRSELARRQLPTVRANREKVAQGDVRQCASAGENRLVLVLKVHPEMETAQVTLVHTSVEYAAESDLVLDPVATGLAYPLVVEGDLRGVVWTADLGRLVSRLDRSIALACLGSRMSATFGSFASGLQLNGPLDARRDFKAAERDSLRRLCSDCTHALLETESIGLHDEVFMALLAPAPDADQMLEALFQLFLTKEDRLHLTLDHVEFLSGQGLLELDRWESALGTRGVAFRQGLLEIQIERARGQALFGGREPDIQLGIAELSAA